MVGVFLFSFTLCMSHRASIGPFEIVGKIPFWCIMRNFQHLYTDFLSCVTIFLVYVQIYIYTNIYHKYLCACEKEVVFIYLSIYRSIYLPIHYLEVCIFNMNQV